MGSFNNNIRKQELCEAFGFNGNPYLLENRCVELSIEKNEKKKKKKKTLILQ